MTAVIIRADARALPLPDESVDLICTSPPYYALRDYRDGDTSLAGQIGSEPTQAAYVAALLDCTREWMRVLKPQGSLFVNLGDKYSGGSGASNSNFQEWARQNGHRASAKAAKASVRSAPVHGMQPKSLLGLPWRYALGCVDQLGLILRAEIIWAKPNGLPESVTDRVRRSHEQVFHFTRQPRYYSAVDEVREPHLEPQRRGVLTWDQRRGRDDQAARYSDQNGHGGTAGMAQNPLGKLPGSVWEIPSQPLTVPAHLGVDHFAAFPMELPRRIIAGWSPPGICTACGEGRRPVVGVDWAKVPHRMVERRALTEDERSEAAECFRNWQDTHGIPSRAIAELFPSRTGGLTGCVANWRQGLNMLTPDQVSAIEDRFSPVPDRLRDLVSLTRLMPVAEFDVGIGGSGTGRHRNRHSVFEPKGYRAITGYACACPQPDAPTRPARVADPFGGTGTTALVADVLGRDGFSFDRSADYCRLARWRTTDPGERARAMQVPKPPPQLDGQGDLFSVEAS